MQSIRSRLVPLACLVLFPLAVACDREPEAEPMPADTPPATMEDAAPPPELQSASDRYIAAWNADDPEAIGTFFTDDATATVGDDTYRGRDEILAEWVRPSAAVISDLVVTETMTERDGDDYRSAGTYTVMVDPPDADAFEGSGSYVATWTRDADGQWRIRSTEVHEHPQPED